MASYFFMNMLFEERKATEELILDVFKATKEYQKPVAFGLTQTKMMWYE